MASIILYSNFSKKKNSTKQPSGGTQVAVALKEETSLSNPTFILSNYNDSWNYCAFKGRYYYIVDVTYASNHLYELHCVCDVLATYKANIGNYTAFIERCSTEGEYNNFINDIAITSQQIIKTSAYKQSPIPNWNSTGCYIVRTVGTSTNTNSGVSTYAMNAEGLKNLLTYAFTSSNYATELQQDIIQSFFNPFQYIISIMWFPFNVTQFGVKSVYVQLGWWRTDAVGYPVTLNGFSINVPLNLPDHYYSDFRKYNPSFEKWNILLPGCGTYELNQLDCQDGLNCAYHIDALTGELLVTLHRGDDSIISSFSGRIGAPIQIGQASVSGSSIISSGVGAVGSAMSGNILGVASETLSAINNIIQPTPSTNGVIGNITSLVAFPKVVVSMVAYGSMESPLTVFGKPCYRNIKINTLSGFIQCGEASIDIPGLGEEKNQVNQALNSGFYFE